MLVFYSSIIIICFLLLYFCISFWSVIGDIVECWMMDFYGDGLISKLIMVVKNLISNKLIEMYMKSDISKKTQSNKKS